MNTSRRSLYLFFLALSAASLIAALASFLVPALAAIIPAFSSEAAGETGVTGSVSATAPTGMFGSRVLVARTLAALRFTLAEALCSSVLAIAIGLPAAYLTARRDFPGRRFLLALSGVPLCVPPMIIALAFVLFYGRQGYLNSFIMRITGAHEPPVTFLYSFAGIVIAHGFYNFPVVLRTVSQVWERLPEEEEDAAVLLGAGRFRVFRTVTLPRLSGSILSSGVLVFLYCFFSFIIVMMFGGIGGTSLEVELYQAARSSFNYRMAGTIALVETCAALGIVALYMCVQRSLSFAETGIRPARVRVSFRGGFETVLAVLYLVFILVFFIGPLFSIVVRSFVVPSSGSGFSGRVTFGFAQWKMLLSRGNFLPALANTVTVAIPVAVISTLAGLLFALLGGREDGVDTTAGSGRRTRALLFRIIPLSPLAVSSVILGFGWTILMPRGNRVTLILAQVAIAWPFAWTQIRAALDRIPPEIEDSAVLLSGSRLDAAFRVRIPLAFRGIVSGAGFVFAISAGDASLPLVLSLGRFENLPLLLFRLAGSYRFSEACACAIVLAVLCGFVFFIGDLEGGHDNQKEKRHG